MAFCLTCFRVWQVVRFVQLSIYFTGRTCCMVRMGAVKYFDNFWIWLNNLLGQLAIWQLRFCLPFPLQGEPPFRASISMDLSRVCEPFPQLWLQSDHLAHPLHLQSSGFSVKVRSIWVACHAMIWNVFTNLVLSKLWWKPLVNLENNKRQELHLLIWVFWLRHFWDLSLLSCGMKFFNCLILGNEAKSNRWLFSACTCSQKSTAQWGCLSSSLLKQLVDCHAVSVMKSKLLSCLALVFLSYAHRKSFFQCWNSAERQSIVRFQTHLSRWDGFHHQLFILQHRWKLRWGRYLHVERPRYFVFVSSNSTKRSKLC